MYIIHLVLMRLIGLVTFPPVNLRLVSKGKGGFAEVWLPPSSSDCPKCLQGAASVQIVQVSRGPLHSKALRCWLKYWYYLKMSLVWYAFIPKDVTRFVWFSPATEAPSEWTLFTFVNYLLASSVQPRYCICPDGYTAQSQKCVKVLRFASILSWC